MMLFAKKLHLSGRRLFSLLIALLLPAAAVAQSDSPEIETQHPALFLVGDSIMHTGTGDGETGPWGWGSEIIPMFDAAKIHVYDEGLGGRSSRGYRQEGAWAKIMNRLQAGDWVIVQFGHNDAANSANYPDRTTAKGNGDETEEIESPVTHEKETIHSYGWYLRQYVKDAESKGAHVIICSPPPRNIWVDGKIVRGLDGYAGWAAEAAHESAALFVDLNTITADKYDALGQEAVRPLFNDTQHSRKAGAHLNAESVVTGIRGLKDCALASDLAAGALNGSGAQTPAHSVTPMRPDPREIPLPVITTTMTPLPGVDQLPDRAEMPDVMTLNNGQRVKTQKQWAERREEMKRTLEWYAVGLAPPPPGNVSGKVISTEMLMGGKVKYRLIHLTFGPEASLGLDIGVFTQVGNAGVPTLISPAGTPPGATPLPRLALGANQGKGEDVLLVTGPAVPKTAGPGANGAGGAPVTGMIDNSGKPYGSVSTAAHIAETNQAIQHGWNFVIFNYSDCGEDTTLRNADGSWAYRTTRFFPAYPNYDWGLLRAWAWGVSRIVDYLETDASVDQTKFVVTGVSRTGKSALIAGAFDERIAMVAPVASSGGGTPAYRFSGSVPDRGGKEGLTEMMKKYPNWFSDHLHQFWGQPDKLPFDEHWFIALCAPRPFIALEGLHDQNVNQNGVYQSMIAAQPAYNFLNATDRLGINFADRPHGMVQGDWDALLAFGDKFLMGKQTKLTFDQYPAGIGPNAR
ncbi:MAG: GDSL-type esterase/lipase family protein [Terracidiphilus sp.]|jgi:lysophospholipase L1-like esterase